MALPPHLAELEGRLAGRVEEALAGFRRAFEERLRAATDRLLEDATNVASPTVAGLLAEVESEAFDAAPRREGARGAATELLDAVRRFDRAANQSELLESLVASGRAHADRVALLLVRDDVLVAFDSAGIQPAPARGHESSFDGVLRERLFAARGCLTLTAEAAADVSLRLGWAPGGAAVVVPLVLRDRIAALLWADRSAAEPELASLQLLTHLAAQRLELQALSDRAFTPTLYQGTEAPGAPLPLWSVPVESAPAPSAEPSAALDELESFEVVAEPLVAPGIEVSGVSESGVSESDTAAELEGASEVEAGMPEPEEEVVDELWTGATEPASEAEELHELPESATDTEALGWEAGAEAGSAEAASVEVSEMFEEVPAASEPTPSPSLDWQSSAFESEREAEPEAVPTLEMEAIAVESDSEADAGAIFEPEGGDEGDAEDGELEIAATASEEAGAPLEFAPSAAPPFEEPPGSEADVLRTMRLPLLAFPLAGAERVPEETTAPLHVEEVSTRSQGASTLEFPVPQEVAAAPASAPQGGSDLTEDATLLTQRYPVMPVMPSIAPEVLAPSAASTAPFATIAASAAAPSIAPPAPMAPMAPLAPAADDPLDRTASRQRSTEVAPPPDLQGPGRAFLGGRAPRATVEPPMHEEARRLARLLISEIKLYNEEQVLEGRRNRDLYHRLKEDIDRSRQIYEERVDPAVRSGSDYFHQELVRSLAGGDPRALGI